MTRIAALMAAVWSEAPADATAGPASLSMLSAASLRFSPARFRGATAFSRLSAASFRFSTAAVPPIASSKFVFLIRTFSMLSVAVEALPIVIVINTLVSPLIVVGDMLGVVGSGTALTLVVDIESAIEVIIKAAITNASLSFTYSSPFYTAELLTSPYLSVLSLKNPPTLKKKL
ncbi:hypothetical protein ES703_28232 [subsurface metagenome]